MNGRACSNQMGVANADWLLLQTPAREANLPLDQ